MSEIVQFPARMPPDPNGELRAALAACDILMRCEAQAMTAGVIARNARLKAACLFAQDAIQRARSIAEEAFTNTTPPKGAA